MNIAIQAAIGILIPFLGTALGAGAVYLFPDRFSQRIKKIFFGFAAGVMQAAAVWSLILPAIEQSGGAGSAALGVLAGIGAFLAGDCFLNRAKRKGSAQGKKARSLLALTVTLHNIPEGMAVGVAFAAVLDSPDVFSVAPALILALGIAIQNVPEGAVISMPLSALGVPKKKAFWQGALSGAVEPAGAVLALVLTHLVLPILPFVLTFAAGAMMYVILSELIPEISGEGEGVGFSAYGAGFVLMMLLDVILG